MFLHRQPRCGSIFAIAGASGTAFVAKAEVAEAPLSAGWRGSTARCSSGARRGWAWPRDQRPREALADNWAVAVF
jgi:1-acyl-sn-glycerol-3-phosphate acyltransferase